MSLDNNSATSEGDGNWSPQFRHLCPVSSHLEAPSKVTLENPLSFLLSTRRTLGEEPEEREKMELMGAILPVWNGVGFYRELTQWRNTHLSPE